jgi:hypothetical protein
MVQMQENANTPPNTGFPVREKNFSNWKHIFFQLGTFFRPTGHFSYMPLRPAS